MFGCLGGTASDTLDGQNALQPTDWARSWALFDGLARTDNKGQVQLSMAESITPNAKGTAWTIRLHSDVRTHAGKPFTSKDVLFSLRRIVENQYFSANALGPIDFANSKPLDSRTLLLKYKKPYSVLVEALALVFSPMVPEGFDPKNPVGTGPYKYKSFTPGETSTFLRNDDYWLGTGPYVDELVIQNIGDEGAAVSALQAGQVDMVNALSASSATVLKSSAQVYATASGSLGMICLNSQMEPFKDVRVRQAFRLGVDRQGMLEQVFGGEGTVGNDIVGKLDPLYDTSIPQRARDVEQAKALLAEAGVSGLKLDMATSPFGAGIVPTAQVFAAQMKDIGVSINVKQQSPTEYFAKTLGQAPLCQDFWFTTPYLINAGMALAGSNAVFNNSHQDDPEYNRLYAEAIATVDQAKKTDLAHQMQRIEYDRGGNIVPYYNPAIDAAANRVHGMEPSAAGIGPNGLYWANIWVD